MYECDKPLTETKETGMSINVLVMEFFVLLWSLGPIKLSTIRRFLYWTGVLRIVEVEFLSIVVSVWGYVM